MQDARAYADDLEPGIRDVGESWPWSVPPWQISRHAAWLRFFSDRLRRSQAEVLRAVDQGHDPLSAIIAVVERGGFVKLNRMLDAPGGAVNKGGGAQQKNQLIG